MRMTELRHGFSTCGRPAKLQCEPNTLTSLSTKNAKPSTYFTRSEKVFLARLITARALESAERPRRSL